MEDMNNPSSKGFDNVRSYPTAHQVERGALIAWVDPEGPLAGQGIEAGMRLVSVDGVDIDDILDWIWLSDETSIQATILGFDGSVVEAQLQRSADEPWGISFSDNVFDGVRTCRNACIFCFMAMLPKGMRDSLYLRDDDYRLSFLQGNFITLTNISDLELERIIGMDLSPLHVSLHAIDPDARLKLMGKNHQRGLGVLGELVEAGIGIHAQIVLCPGINDGDVLEQTLRFAIDTPEILSIGIVPVGYTRYQRVFERSYEDRGAALAAIELVEGLQRFEMSQGLQTKIQLADEFYVSAFGEEVHAHLPEADLYDGYPQFYDGIGMLRSFLDDWNDCIDALRRGEVEYEAGSKRFSVVCGRSFETFFAPLLQASPFAGDVDLIGVDNGFFGGNVDVCGLLCGCDVVSTLEGCDIAGREVILPAVMFNDDGLTLDNMDSVSIERAISSPVTVISLFANDMFEYFLN